MNNTSMFPLLGLIKFGSKFGRSHSFLVDIQQIYIRNVILFCAGLSTARLLFGENIICQVLVKSVTQSFIDTKCFINGTMTMGDPTFYHDYYQWVSVYLLLLAYSFYFPYSVWNKLFGTCIRELENVADKPEDAIQTIKISKGNNLYLKTWALELFYAAYLGLLLYVTNQFFNDGWHMNEWSWKTIYKIFPDSGTCYVTYFQSAGSTDGKFNCLLPLCSVYRKVFAALYALFGTLVLLNGIVFIYRFQVLFIRRKHVDVWWKISIVKRQCTTWNARQRYDEFWKNTLCKKISDSLIDLDQKDRNCEKTSMIAESLV